MSFIEDNKAPDLGLGSAGYLSGRLKGIIDVSLSDTPQTNSFTGINDINSALRISFDPASEPYINFTDLRVKIEQNDDGQKILVGGFDDVDGNTVISMQIPLESQTIQSLSKAINEFPAVSSQVLNQKEFLSAKNLDFNSGLTFNATNRWAYFCTKKGIGFGSDVQGSLNRDIKYYYTSIEPGIPQNNPSRSIGGYVSPTELYLSDYIIENLSLNGLSLKLNSNSLEGEEYLQINDEIIKIENWNGNIANISERRVFNTPIRHHFIGSVVRKITFNNIFDNNFNSEGKQYRCFALKNVSSTEIARNVTVFFGINNRNSLSNFRVSVEIPRNSFYQGTVSSSDNTNEEGNISFVDNNVISLFTPKHFNNCSITFTTGNNSSQLRIIKDFDYFIGKFIMDKELPFSIQIGDQYKIEASPAQRLKSSLVAPITNIHNVAPNSPFIIGEFSEAKLLEHSIDINPFSIRSNSENIYPNDVIYLWIERSISSRNDEFINNRIFITVKYQRI